MALDDFKDSRDYKDFRDNKDPKDFKDRLAHLRLCASSAFFRVIGFPESFYIPGPPALLLRRTSPLALTERIALPHGQDRWIVIFVMLFKASASYVADT